MNSKSQGSIRNITNYLTQEDWDLTQFSVGTRLLDAYVDIHLRLQLPTDSTKSQENTVKLARWIELVNLYHSAQ